MPESVMTEIMNAITPLIGKHIRFSYHVPFFNEGMHQYGEVMKVWMDEKGVNVRLSKEGLSFNSIGKQHVQGEHGEYIGFRIENSTEWELNKEDDVLYVGIYGEGEGNKREVYAMAGIFQE